MELSNPAAGLMDSYKIGQQSFDLANKSTQDSPEALLEVAKQFESLYMNLMLKNMRAANREFSEGNYLNSFETNMYEDMLDEKLSVSMSSSGGFGIAEMLVKQLGNKDYTADYDISIGARPAEPVGEKSVEKALPAIKKQQPAGRMSGFASPDTFVATLMPEIEKIAGQLEVSPKSIIAQAALETGWGQHIIHNGQGRNSFNLFGIKAHGEWSGESVAIESVEVVGDVAKLQKSHFRQYSSYADSLHDYAEMISSGRYPGVVGSGDDVPAFAKSIADGGYATDPAYAEKLTRVANNPLLNLSSLVKEVN
jgi:flagellar protein FlgJ